MREPLLPLTRRRVIDTVARKKIYVVVRGRRPGIYRTWSGEEGAAQQVHGFSGALYKGFTRREDAGTWLASLDEGDVPAGVRERQMTALRDGESNEPFGGEEGQDGDRVIIYTDGGAIDNPGPGGYGAVLRYGGRRRELSGGYRLTTNNRMELMACIRVLEALQEPSYAVLYSDSTYVVNGITEGWAEGWRRHDWERANGETAENVDLWARLLELVDEHDVEFRWVKGHAGRPGNERADQLASQAMRRNDLPPDEAYEAGETQTLTPRLL